MGTKPCPPVYFYIPTNLDLSIFPTEWKWYIAYFLNLLHWKWICWQADGDNLIHLKFKLLRRVIPETLWPRIRKELVMKGIIDWNLWYQPGYYSYGYRLLPEYHQSYRIVCGDSNLSHKIRLLQTREESSLLPVHRWLQGKLGLFRFDLKKAGKIITRLEPDEGSPISVEEYRYQQLAHCQKLADGECSLTCDRFGRVHTLLTSLPRELRCCLSLSGKPVVGLDLSNSQPLIAGICARNFCRSADTRYKFIRKVFNGKGDVYCYKMLAGWGEDDPIPLDLSEYLEMCQQGQFYESFTPAGGDRDQTKLRFYRDVFFGKNCYRGPVKDAFEKRYPSVAGMLKFLKRKEYSRAAWVLQNVESTIFIHAICGKIMRERPGLPVATIHDSFLTVPGEVAFIRSAILSEFGKWGIHPTLRKEDYNHAQERF